MFSEALGDAVAQGFLFVRLFVRRASELRYLHWYGICTGMLSVLVCYLYWYFVICPNINQTLTYRSGYARLDFLFYAGGCAVFVLE